MIISSDIESNIGLVCVAERWLKALEYLPPPFSQYQAMQGGWLIRHDSGGLSVRVGYGRRRTLTGFKYGVYEDWGLMRIDPESGEEQALEGIISHGQKIRL